MHLRRSTRDPLRWPAGESELRYETRVAAWGADLGSHIRFIVHHVVKRKTRVQTRRREELEKCTVARVARIAIAAAIGVAEAKPWLHFDGKLPPRLRYECRRVLCLASPRAVLQRAPEHEVELS